MTEHLLRAGKGGAQRTPEQRTIKATLSTITERQGVFLEGAPKGDVIDKVVTALVRASMY